MHKVIPLLFTLLLFFDNTLNAQESQKLSLGLDDLFQLADERNRALKISSYDEQLMAEEIRQQKNHLLPSLDASLSFSYNGDGWLADRDFKNGMLAAIPDFGNNFALEATQVVYAGGAIKTSIEMAKLNMVLAQLDKEKNKQDIRFLLTGYALELKKIQNQKQILQHNLQQTKKLLQQIENKFKQGVALKNAITRYELQEQSLQLALIKLENAEKIINNELLKTLQLPKGTALQIVAFATSPIAEQYTSSQWQALAQENAPVLHQMQVQLEQAKHQETLAKSDKLPQVFAFAGDHFDGPITIEVPPVNKNFNYWYAGVGIKYHIASLYKSKAKIKASKIASQKVIEQEALVQDQLLTDIESSMIRSAEAKKVYETQLKAVQLATENYTIIRNRYLDDLVLMTEMLDAENAKIDAEMKVANAQINILYHHYQLKKLSGTL